MSERDYIQQPVDVGYEQGIQQMGRGKRTSAAEWFEAIARTMAMGLAMRGGVGSPSFSPAQREAVLRDFKNAMGRLLRGNAPPKEPDPRIVQQFEGTQQRAGTAPGHISNVDDSPYQSVVPVPWVPTIAQVSTTRGIPRVMPVRGGMSYPMLQIKGEFWPKGSIPTPDEWSMLQRLEGRGLWP